MELLGLHHVTAVTANAASNVAFYTQALGLRLVKKTVNQDDVSAYHLFYGDEAGSPGTEVTFFDWPHVGAHRPGTGEVAAIALSIPTDSLDWWVSRLDQMGVPHGEVQQHGRYSAVAFTDPEGQRLELVASGGTPTAKPWSGSPVPQEHAIRGMHSVTLVVESITPTEQVLTTVMGFRRTGEYSWPENDSRRVVIFETAQGGPGAEVHLEERPEMPRSRLGRGGVHHVAFRTPTPEEHAQWRERAAAARLGVTPVIDRYYFRSIYFREPQGVLFEIATDGPGFATDEDIEHLGERLSLPPFLEPHRAEIEAGLTPIGDMAAPTAR